MNVDHESRSGKQTTTGSIVLEILCGGALGIVAPQLLMHGYTYLMEHTQLNDILSPFTLTAWELSVNYALMPALFLATGLVVVLISRTVGFGKAYYGAFLVSFVIFARYLIYAFFVVLALSLKYAL